MYASSELELTEVVVGSVAMGLLAKTLALVVLKVTTCEPVGVGVVVTETSERPFELDSAKLAEDD